MECLKWWTLAAASQNRVFGVASETSQNRLSKDASEARDKLAKLMNLEAVAEAQRRAASFVARPQFDYSTNHFGIAAPKQSGTGFFVTEDGYLLTNFHVIDGAKSIIVTIGKRKLPARVKKADKNQDVALLKVDGVFRPLPIIDSREVELGASVFTLGFPDPDVQGYEPKLTTGTVSSLFGMRDDRRYFQISVPIQPGNSGGPLVDQSGAVVGVVSERLNDFTHLLSSGLVPQNVNYAIKSSVILDFLASVPEMPSKLKPVDSAEGKKLEGTVQVAQGAIACVQAY